MAHYLVKAKPRQEKMKDLREALGRNAFIKMEPFGKALTYSLENARIRKNGYAIWEEEDYCSPPLKQERAAVLDDYFADIQFEEVKKGQGWKQIEELPKLFGDLEE
jgi:hypothetical protein